MSASRALGSLMLVVIALGACGGPSPTGFGSAATSQLGAGDSGRVEGDGFGGGGATPPDAESGPDGGAAAGSDDAVDTGPAVPTVAFLVASTEQPSAEVGAPVSVVCTALDAAGQAMTPQPPGISLSAAAPLQVLAAEAGFGLAVTSKQSGAFDLRCTLSSAGLNSQPLQLTFVPGPAAKILTVLEKSTVTAGDVGSKVSCVAHDAFGNALPAGGAGLVDATIGAAEGIFVAIDTVSGEKAGDFAVYCQPKAAHAALPVVKALLTIVPGAPMRARAVIAPEEAKVDVFFTVVCTAYDDYDNVIAPQPADFTLVLPEGCQATGLKFSCKKAGSHVASCASPQVPKSIPQGFKVLAGKAVKLKLLLDPDKPNYGTGQVIQLIGEASDTYGNAIESPELTPIQVKPSDLVKIDALNARVSMHQDGLYQVKVGVAGAPGVSATRDVRIDTSGPLIDISSPPRGHSAIWAATLKVTFSVVDELSKLGAVLFQGKAVSVGDGIGVAQSMPLGHGIQAITVEGQDEWGNASRHVQAVLAAKKYVATETNAGAAAQLTHGFAFWLGQQAIDSGVRVHSKPRDLATVFEIVLKNLDMSVIVGKTFPVDVTGLKGTATIKGLTYGDNNKNKGFPQVKLQAKTGLLELDGTLWNVDAKVHLGGKGIGFIPVNLDATVTASSMQLLADVVLGASTTAVTVKSKNVQVQLKDLDVSIDNGWGFLVNWLLDLFNGTITNLLESTLSTQVGAALDVPLSNALSNVGIDTTMQLPSLYGAPSVKVDLTTAPVGLTVLSASGSMAAGVLLALRTAVTSVKSLPHPHLGAPMRWGCLGSGPELAKLPRQLPIEGAMHFDLANQLFAALWQAGGLQFKLDGKALSSFNLASFGLGALAIDVDMRMPPVLSDCTVDGTVELQLGDVQLDVKTTMDGQEVVIRAYLTAAAKVAAIKVAGANGPEIGLDIQGIVRLDGDVDSVLVDGVAAPEGTVGFFEKLLPFVASALISALQGTLASFPLPELDLSAMAVSIPKGTVLALDISKISNQPGNVLLSGGVKK